MWIIVSFRMWSLQDILQVDRQIFQGCKTVSSLPYGTLLGKIGNGPIFFAGKGGTDAGWFEAEATGPLYLRINDNEACHLDNEGEIAVTIAKERVNLADNIKPGGTWIEPNDNFVVGERRLKLAARVSDNPGGSGIARVHFTAWWPGVDDAVWYVICADIEPKPGTNDVYECEWDLTWVPNGQVRVSFDVYDKAGNKNLAPNGVHKGTFQKETPPVAEEWKCDWLLGCVFRINHENTQEIIEILDNVGAPGVDDQLIYACASLLFVTAGSPPGWGCILFAAGLQIGLPLTQILLTEFDTGEGVVIYFFYGSTCGNPSPGIIPD